MDTTDQLLVRRLAGQGDQEAFCTLLSRYADMVYSTCMRILRDEAQAADVTQETFFQLFKGANRITGSPGGWLHEVATRRAIDLVRQNISRRKREDSYARMMGEHGSSWADVEPLLDAALDRLPQDHRDLLIQHFLQRKSMTQIAAEKSISQPTISRRVAEALEMVRGMLRDEGVLLGTVPLQVMLLHSAEAAPEALLKALGKVSLAQAASVQAAVTGAGVGSLGGTAAAALVGVAAVVAVLVNYSVRPPEWAPTRPLIIRQPQASNPTALVQATNGSLTPSALPTRNVAAFPQRTVPVKAAAAFKPPPILFYTNKIPKKTNTPDPVVASAPRIADPTPVPAPAGLNGVPPFLQHWEQPIFYNQPPRALSGNQATFASGLVKPRPMNSPAGGSDYPVVRRAVTLGPAAVPGQPSASKRQRR